MTGYWDIHNHILPGVDDGSGCMRETMEMLEEEYRQGVRHIVFTPHYRRGMFAIPREEIQTVYARVCEMAADRFPEMEFYLGCEYYIHSDASVERLRGNPKTYEEEIKKMGGQVFFVDNFKKVIAFNKKLDEILKNNNYKTVQIHDPFVVGFIYHTLRKNNVKNIIVHSHATMWSDKKLNGIRNRILCVRLKSQIDYAFACSRAAGDFLYRNKNFYVMNNAIELNRYAYNEVKRKEMRNTLQLNGKIVFGHVGNMCAQKNHLFLLDIFKEIVNLNRNSKLILIGDGVLRKAIEERIKAYQLEEQVLILGKKSDVENYYQAMDCMILPSLYEGLPMVGVEAQCAGVPIDWLILYGNIIFLFCHFL